MGDLEEATEYKIRVVLIADDYNMYDENDIPSALALTKCESRYSNIIELICFLYEDSLFFLKNMLMGNLSSEKEAEMESTNHSVHT